MSRSRSISQLAGPVLAATALALVGAACSSSPPKSSMGGSSAQAPAQGGGGEQVRLVTSEWQFAPGNLQVPSGRPVSLVLENQGQIEHDVMIPGVGLHVVAGPRQTKQTTITFDKPGTYDFECSLPGHKEAGMKGKLVVAG